MIDLLEDLVTIVLLTRDYMQLLLLYLFLFLVHHRLLKLVYAFCYLRYSLLVLLVLGSLLNVSSHLHQQSIQQIIAYIVT